MHFYLWFCLHLLFGCTVHKSVCRFSVESAQMQYGLPEIGGSIAT